MGNIPKLYVGNLSDDVNEERLRSFFSKYGEITDTLVVRDRNDPSKSRGFGFVTFAEDVRFSALEKRTCETG